MAKNKSRKIGLYKIKAILLYFVVLLLFILCFVATIIFLDTTAAKICLIAYEVAIIIVWIMLPIIGKKVVEKEAKQKIQYGLSKEEYDRYRQQSENCDIYAK